MKHEIQSFLETKQNLINRFKAWVTDKSVPLEERWELFIKSDLGDISTYYENPPGIDWNKHTLYDDFYYDKYATCKAKDILERVQEEEEKFSWDENKEVEFKEFFLNKFLKGFINDW